jgi:hypothetical protein
MKTVIFMCGQYAKFKLLTGTHNEMQECDQDIS